MSNLFSSAIENLEKIEDNSQETSMINVRPGTKLSAMLEILSKLRNEPVSLMLFNQIPDKLEVALLHQHNSHEIISEMIMSLIDENGDKAWLELEPGSVLAKMEKKGLISIASPFSKQIRFGNQKD